MLLPGCPPPASNLRAPHLPHLSQNKDRAAAQHRQAAAYAAATAAPADGWGAAPPPRPPSRPPAQPATTVTTTHRCVLGMCAVRGFLPLAPVPACMGVVSPSAPLHRWHPSHLRCCPPTPCSSLGDEGEEEVEFGNDEEEEVLGESTAQSIVYMSSPRGASWGTHG